MAHMRFCSFLLFGSNWMLPLIENDTNETSICLKRPRILHLCAYNGIQAINLMFTSYSFFVVFLSVAHISKTFNCAYCFIYIKYVEVVFFYNQWQNSHVEKHCQQQKMPSENDISSKKKQQIKCLIEFLNVNSKWRGKNRVVKLIRSVQNEIENNKWINANANWAFQKSGYSHFMAMINE